MVNMHLGSQMISFNAYFTWLFVPSFKQRERLLLCLLFALMIVVFCFLSFLFLNGDIKKIQ